MEIIAFKDHPGNSIFLRLQLLQNRKVSTVVKFVNGFGKNNLTFLFLHEPLSDNSFFPPGIFVFLLIIVAC